MKATSGYYKALGKLLPKPPAKPSLAAKPRAELPRCFVMAGNYAQYREWISKNSGPGMADRVFHFIHEERQLYGIRLGPEDSGHVVGTFRSWNAEADAIIHAWNRLFVMREEGMRPSKTITDEIKDSTMAQEATTWVITEMERQGWQTCPKCRFTSPGPTGKIVVECTDFARHAGFPVARPNIQQVIDKLCAEEYTKRKYSVYKVFLTKKELGELTTILTKSALHRSPPTGSVQVTGSATPRLTAYRNPITSEMIDIVERPASKPREALSHPLGPIIVPPTLVAPDSRAVIWQPVGGNSAIASTTFETFAIGEASGHLLVTKQKL